MSIVDAKSASRGELGEVHRLLLQAACTLVAVAMVHSDKGRATAIALGIFAPLTAGHSDSRRESAE